MRSAGACASEPWPRRPNSCAPLARLSPSSPPPSFTAPSSPLQHRKLHHRVPGQEGERHWGGHCRLRLHDPRVRAVPLGRRLRCTPCQGRRGWGAQSLQLYTRSSSPLGGGPLPHPTPPHPTPPHPPWNPASARPPAPPAPAHSCPFPCPLRPSSPDNDLPDYSWVAPVYILDSELQSETIAACGDGIGAVVVAACRTPNTEAAPVCQAMANNTM